MIPCGGFGACASATMIVFEVPSVAAAAGLANTPAAAVARMSALNAVMPRETRGRAARLEGWLQQLGELRRRARGAAGRHSLSHPVKTLDQPCQARRRRRPA